MPFDIMEEKRKRHRRTATEIQRHFKCLNPECNKSYGSEGSLNQHMKLKHPEEFQKYAAANPGAASLQGSLIHEEDSEEDEKP